MNVFILTKVFIKTRETRLKIFPPTKRLPNNFHFNKHVLELEKDRNYNKNNKNRIEAKLKGCVFKIYIFSNGVKCNYVYVWINK